MPPTRRLLYLRPCSCGDAPKSAKSTPMWSFRQAIDLQQVRGSVQGSHEKPTVQCYIHCRKRDTKGWAERNWTQLGGGRRECISARLKGAAATLRARQCKRMRARSRRRSGCREELSWRHWRWWERVSTHGGL